jgi:hypothetical protein
MESWISWTLYILTLVIVFAVAMLGARANQRDVIKKSAELQQRNQNILQEISATNREILAVLKEIRDKR